MKLSKEDQSTLITSLAEFEEEIEDQLTDNEKQVLIYKLKGLTQTQQASLMNVSQPRIAQLHAQVKKKLSAITKSIDQEYVVVETTTLFDEVEKQAWKLHNKANVDGNTKDSLKALNLVMSAREKQIKLLMDLGIIKRVAVEHEHTLKQAPFLEKFESLDKPARVELATDVIKSKLSSVGAPKPPQLEENIEDAEFEEDG